MDLSPLILFADYFDSRIEMLENPFVVLTLLCVLVCTLLTHTYTVAVAVACKGK